MAAIVLAPGRGITANEREPDILDRFPEGCDTVDQLTTSFQRSKYRDRSDEGRLWHGPDRPLISLGEQKEGETSRHRGCDAFLIARRVLKSGTKIRSQRSMVLRGWCGNRDNEIASTLRLAIHIRSRTLVPSSNVVAENSSTATSSAVAPGDQYSEYDTQVQFIRRRNNRYRGGCLTTRRKSGPDPGWKYPASRQFFKRKGASEIRTR